MLLAVVRAPSRAGAVDEAARASGLTAVEIKMRLAGTLPRVLLVADPGRVDEVASALEALGFVVVSFDPTVAPGDDERVVARRVELGADGLVAFDGLGAAHPCPARAVSLIQRGARIGVSERKVTRTERKLALGKAVLTGGLMWSDKVETTSVEGTETRDALALLHRSDGEPDLMLYERQIDYRALGAAMQASSFANLESLVTHLRARVPQVPVDDRVGRPGFVTGLPVTSADPLDLALFLVALAHRRELSLP